MFKVNNKDTRTPLASLWRLSLLLAVNIFHTLLWVYFTPCSSASIVDFEYIIAGWVYTLEKLPLAHMSYLALYSLKFMQKETFSKLETNQYKLICKIKIL